MNDLQADLVMRSRPCVTGVAAARSVACSCSSFKMVRLALASVSSTHEGARRRTRAPRV